MNRAIVGIDANVRTFLRTPLTVALALVLPVVVIEGWGQAMAGLPAMPTVESIPIELGRLLGGIFGVAIIAGMMGLVQMISAREADRRLVLAGYPPRTVLATRLVTLVAVVVAVAAVNFGVIRLTITPAAPLYSFGSLVIAGLVYAFIGALVGAALPRLFEGSLVVVFLAMSDAFLSGDSPLAADAPAFVEYFPLYHPKELLQDAVFDGTVATGDVAFVVAYLLGLLAVVTLVFGVTMRTGEGWSA